MADFTYLNDIFGCLVAVDPFSFNIEIPDDAKEMMQRQLDNAESAVAERTNQATALISIVIVPIAIFVGLFILKVFYDIFTKTADTVADGISDATDRIKSTMYKMKSNDSDSDDGEYDSEEEEDGEIADEKKSSAGKGRKRMLFGEIITKYILEHITEEDIEKALAAQSSESPDKKLGEILLEAGHITNSDILRALKIQEKQGKV